MRARDISWLLAALLPFCLAWGISSFDDLVVVRDGASHSVGLDRPRSYAATPLADLALALGYQKAGAALRMDGETVRFSPGTPFFTVGEEVYQLPNPVYRSGSDLMVPLSWSLE